MGYLGLIIGFGVGFAVAWFIFRPKVGDVLIKEDIVAKRQQSAVDYLKQNREITNDEYQKLTKVSDAQATRDLDELEKQGIVEQIGDTGRYVKYRLKS